MKASLDQDVNGPRLTGASSPILSASGAPPSVGTSSHCAEPAAAADAWRAVWKEVGDEIRPVW